MSWEVNLVAWFTLRSKFLCIKYWKLAINQINTHPQKEFLGIELSSNDQDAFFILQQKIIKCSMQVWCTSEYSQARGIVASNCWSAKLCIGGQNNGYILTLSILLIIPSLGSRCTENVTSYQVNAGIWSRLRMFWGLEVNTLP